jgi:hypothetical protein
MGVFLLILAVWILILLLRYHVLTGNCYDHVEELLKGDQYAGRRRMRAVRLGPAPGGGLYQPTAITPANPHLHVRLVPGLLFAIWPARDALRSVVVHWTPLVPYPDSEWRGDLTDRGRPLPRRRDQPGPPGRHEPAPPPHHHHPRLTLPPTSKRAISLGFPRVTDRTSRHLLSRRRPTGQRQPVRRVAGEPPAPSRSPQIGRHGIPMSPSAHNQASSCWRGNTPARVLPSRSHPPNAATARRPDPNWPGDGAPAPAVAPTPSIEPGQAFKVRGYGRWVVTPAGNWPKRARNSRSRSLPRSGRCSSCTATAIAWSS